jgi:hypothetical protein
MSFNPYKNIHFEGKQDDEVILYVIHPHWLMLLVRLFKTVCRAAVFILAWAIALHLFPQILIKFELRGYSIAAIIIFLDLAWQLRFYFTYNAYITDRRIVVVKSVFPVTIKRLTLFWKDAVKGRDIANSFIWRLIKIGTVEISAKLFQGFSLQNAKDNPLGSEIQIRFVKNFVEITNYIDNLIHLTAHNPEKIPALKPFGVKDKSVARPPQKLIEHSKTSI